MNILTLPSDLLPGTQIAYIPTHLQDDLPDNPTFDDLWALRNRGVEFGFVVSRYPDGAACRFWYPKSPSRPELRTRSCSEIAMAHCIFPVVFCRQEHVEKAMHDFQIASILHG